MGERIRDKRGSEPASEVEMEFFDLRGEKPDVEETLDSIDKVLNQRPKKRWGKLDVGPCGCH